jgi:hypothetical protein
MGIIEEGEKIFRIGASEGGKKLADFVGVKSVVA